MSAQRTFCLYSEDADWCSAADYGAIVDVTERLRPETVLEFGPGWSTFALIEGGAGHVNCCEADPHWFDVWADRLFADHFGLVSMIPYEWCDPLRVSISEARMNGRLYDMGLVDGPVEVERRPAVIEYCIARCRHVLVPLEESHGDTLTTFCIGLVKRERVKAMELFNTGPLAGSFALLTC